MGLLKDIYISDWQSLSSDSVWLGSIPASRDPEFRDLTSVFAEVDEIFGPGYYPKSSFPQSSFPPPYLILTAHAAPAEDLEHTQRIDAFCKFIDAVMSHGVAQESDEFGRVRPSAFGIASAVRLSMDAWGVCDFPANNEVDVDRDGALRITWSHSNREIELVCPYDGSEQPYCFRSKNNRASEVHPKVSGEILRRLVSWTLKGNDGE